MTAKLLGSFGIARRVRAPDHDRGPVLGHPFGHPQPDATIAARHKSDFARQIKQRAHGAYLSFIATYSLIFCLPSWLM